MSSPPAAAPELLEVAAGIGRRLADEAIWDDGRCNWIGGQVVPGPFNRLIEHQGALDTTLYEGTAGVALCLAELYAAAGEDEMRRTAIGAIRQALEFGRDPARGRALYSGRTGIAVVAARLGGKLDEPELVDAARELAQELADAATGDEEELDLLNGTSGTLLGLLALGRLLDEPGLVAAATRLGDELLDAAEEDEL